VTYARVRSYGGRYLVHGMAVLAAAISPICTCDAQYVTENQGPNSLLSQELSKYPDLPNELANLVSRFQENVHFPAPRTESRLLPLLPQSTVAYVAIPNYGDTASQVVGAFRQELSEDPKLRDWWAHGAAAEAGPKVVSSLQEFSELNGYLGDEIVLFATMTGKEPAFVAISEIRKPGLKKFLQDTAVQYWGTSKPAVRVFDSAELASAKEKALTGQLLILVRSDFVVASSDLQTVRKISAGFDGHSREFAATAFGRRMAQEYRDGVTIVAGADVHGIVEKASPETAQSPAFQKSGFADMQYLVWNRKTIGGKKVGQLELSFTGPRHGAAAWLAKPTALGSYNFVSPHAFMAASLVLANPVQIFGDAQELARLSGSNAFAAIPAFEQALNLSL